MCTRLYWNNSLAYSLQTRSLPSIDAFSITCNRYCCWSASLVTSFKSHVPFTRHSAQGLTTCLISQATHLPWIPPFESRCLEWTRVDIAALRERERLPRWKTPTTRQNNKYCVSKRACAGQSCMSINAFTILFCPNYGCLDYVYSHYRNNIVDQHLHSVIAVTLCISLQL